jgi:predicted aconitase with swiveling domain
MRTLLTSLALALAVTAADAQSIGDVMAQNQTVFRDSRGSTTGTATTDSQGTTVFRDARGSTIGTAATTNQGSAGTTTIFRDSRGSTTGTASTPPTLTFGRGPR